MKTLVLFAVLALGGAAFAQEKACPMCPVTPQPKVAASHECDKCLAAQPCDHCDSLTAKNPDARERAFWAEAMKMQANDKVEHGELMACCAGKVGTAKTEDCCATKANMAVGVKAPTCSHDEKGHADHGMKHDGVETHGMSHGKKGTEGHGKKMAAFKVYAGGQYHFFCCDHMATEAIAGFRAQGMTVGNVQKVVGKHVL